MEAAINSLPDETLERIFSYCTHEDLVRSIQDVCCRWREVAQSTGVWKAVTYCPDYKARSEQVVEMLQISRKLQNIILRYNCDDTVLRAITDNCAELRRLEIEVLPDLDLKFLKNLQDKCPKVQYLSIPQPVLAELNKCEMVGKWTNLKVLRLPNVSDRTFLMKFKPIADLCKELEELEIGDNKFVTNDLRYLVSMRKETLHTLAVSCCDKSGECVLPALSTCHLKSLSLFSYSDCRRHYKKIKHFGRLKTVTTLSIADFNSEIESDDLKQIFENGNMAQLVELKLEELSYVDDDVTKVIVRNCPLLKRLSLISCYQMTDASLKIITNLKELNSLTINCTDCATDTGIFYLRHVRGLKRLKISWCPAGFRNLVKLSKLQDLTLEWLDLAEFPWGQVPRYMKCLQYLRIYHCRNVDTCAVEKLKTVLRRLKVELKVSKYDDLPSAFSS